MKRAFSEGDRVRLVLFPDVEGVVAETKAKFGFVTVVIPDAYPYGVPVRTAALELVGAR